VDAEQLDPMESCWQHSIVFPKNIERRERFSKKKKNHECACPIGVFICLHTVVVRSVDSTKAWFCHIHAGNDFPTMFGILLFNNQLVIGTQNTTHVLSACPETQKQLHDFVFVKHMQQIERVPIM
jgi:hypothetical protein